MKDICKHLQVSCQFDNVTRLGSHKENQWRPMKVILKSKDDRDKIFANLRKLKGMQHIFGKISISRDYTESDRKLKRICR